jgi:hypothetical protein
MPEPEKVSTPPPVSDPLTTALAALKPATEGLNRDGLMYAAGAESRHGVLRLWQAAAGFMAAVGFAAGMFFRPGGVEREKIVYVEMPVVSAPSALPASNSPPEPVNQLIHRPSLPTVYGRAWLQFRSDVLTLGLSLVPPPDEKR